MAVAEPCDPLLVETARSVTVVDHDKIIPGTVHLGELQIHRGILPQDPVQGKHEGEFFPRLCATAGKNQRFAP
jgi:hypothetical protein